MTSETLSTTTQACELTCPRYALVVRLPRQAEVHIEDMYLRLPGVTRPTMGYHITLLGSFLLGEGAELGAFDPVRAVCASWPPFTVHVAGLGVFGDGGANTVYLGVVECDRMAALHRALLQALEGRITFPSEQYRLWNTTAYQPHVTLSLSLSDRALSDLLEAGQRRMQPEVVRVQSVWLVAQSPASSWQYLAEYPLGELNGK